MWAQTAHALTSSETVKMCDFGARACRAAAAGAALSRVKATLSVAATSMVQSVRCARVTNAGSTAGRLTVGASCDMP